MEENGIPKNFAEERTEVGPSEQMAPKEMVRKCQRFNSFFFIILINCL